MKDYPGFHGLVHAAKQIAKLSIEAEAMRYEVSEAMTACKGAWGAYTSDPTEPISISHITMWRGKMGKGPGWLTHSGQWGESEFYRNLNRGLPAGLYYRLNPTDYKGYAEHTTCEICKHAAIVMAKYISIRRSIASYKGQVMKLGKQLLALEARV